MRREMVWFTTQNNTEGDAIYECIYIYMTSHSVFLYVLVYVYDIIYDYIW